MEKKINYIARDFNSIKNELITFSKRNYPTLAKSFEDSSVGSWFIDLLAATADDLSYSIDRAYQENDINSSKLKSSALNIARMNGVKVPGPKASMVEVELSCTLPVDEKNGNAPNWKSAPIVKRDTQVAAGSFIFELDEDVDFAEQFNENGYSNRKFEPLRDSNGIITAYTVSKSVMAVAGTTKVYKKVIGDNELQPFMEVILPDLNVMNIESIIFKSTTGLTVNPQNYEFFVDEEEFMVKGDYVTTYRFFETKSLADLYRYGTETNTLNGYYSGRCEIYDDYTETFGCDGKNTESSVRTTRIYKGKWKPIKQKFITEFTNNGYMKIIFGSGSSDVVPNASTYAGYRMSNIVNNDMLGVLPQIGWTMFVLYRVGGGAETNIAKGAIKTINYLNITFPNSTANAGQISNSLRVTNLSNALGGKDAPSVEEIKALTKYNVGSQERCVTVNDYKARIAQMPPKYGCPFRYNAIEENNKIVMPFLMVNPYHQLDTALPNRLVDNVKEYLKGYKNITDYVEMKSGKIYNLGFEVELFIDKNYTTDYVLKTVIETIKNYFEIDNHMMGDSVFVGDLEKEITKLDGVISIIDFRVYNIYGGSYGSNAKFPIYSDTDDSCSIKTVERFLIPSDESCVCDRIDLDALDSVLENDYDSMFEIKNQSDIVCKCKLR